MNQSTAGTAGGRPAQPGCKRRGLAPLGLLAGLALGACTFGGPAPTGQARANAAALAACRERAEQVYEQQNRAAIYSPPPAINTPQSGMYAPGGSMDRGLADRYARDRMIDDCVRNTGSETIRGENPGPR